jgi:ribosomal protein S18 acetylase RimI-like enzyme
MEELVPIRSGDQVEVVTDVINRSFLTVAKDFGFTKESVSHFPAFIGKEVLEKQIHNGLQMFGFISEDTCIGCIGIKREDDNGLYKIERLAVLPERRHNAIGRTLMDFAVKEIRKEGGKRAVVEIVNENTQLKNWYIGQGFLEIRIDTYERLPFTVGVLEKDLSR